MMNERGVAVEVKDLGVRYGENVVVDGVSFRIFEGDIAVIIGPNGSGKSTLLKAILGLVRHTGTVRLLGVAGRGMLPQIGYVPQRFDFDRSFPITVEEFLALTPEATEECIAKALQEVDMLKHRSSLLGTLSGGQMQRVLIARAILHVPKILFLDEPTSGIDVEGIKDFYAILKHLNAAHGVTIVMVSHELNVIHSFAHTVICLNKNLVCFGEPRVVLDRVVLERLYGPEYGVREHLHQTKKV